MNQISHCSHLLLLTTPLSQEAKEEPYFLATFHSATLTFSVKLFTGVVEAERQAQFYSST